MNPTKRYLKTGGPRSSIGFWVVLATAIAGWFAGDSFSVFFWAVIISIWSLGLWTASLTLCFLWVLFRSGSKQTLRKQFQIWVSTLLLLPVFFGTAKAKESWRFHQVKNFVDLASHQLEDEKGRTHSYRHNLPPLLDQRKPSHLGYKSDGGTYSFTYKPTLSFFDFQEFNSVSRSWENIDF